MKPLSNRNARRGISMTEYLIILSIVAVAAIAVVGLFGKQIKSAFVSNTSAMGGKEKANTPVTEGTVNQSSMGDFEKGAAGETGK